VVAAAFVAFDPVSTWYAAHFWAEPVFVLLLWFGIERVMAGDATGRLLPIATGGFAIGIAALTREPALYVLPLVAAWVGLGRRKRSLLQAGLLLAVALLTVAPGRCATTSATPPSFPSRPWADGRFSKATPTARAARCTRVRRGRRRARPPIAQHRFAMQEGLRAIRVR
jgi:4-amino-4-deoxy-L-arabinose transferase-like glycosyltransferase